MCLHALLAAQATCVTAACAHTHKYALQKHAQVTGRLDVSKDGDTANPCTATAIMTPLNARTIALRDRTMVRALCVRTHGPRANKRFFLKIVTHTGPRSMDPVFVQGLREAKALLDEGILTQV